MGRFFTSLHTQRVKCKVLKYPVRLKIRSFVNELKNELKIPLTTKQMYSSMKISSE